MSKKQGSDFDENLENKIYFLISLLFDISTSD
jgi:hypothetical protein